MATYRKLKSGKWQTIIRKPGYKNLYKTFINKLMAQRWAKETEIKIEKSIYEDYFEAQNIIFKDLIQKYILENASKQKSKKSTIHKLNFLTRQKVAELNLMQIKAKDIIELKNKLDQSKAPKTVNDYILLLSRIWNCAKMHWSIPLPNISPFQFITLHKINNVRTKVLSREEYQLLLSKASESKAYYLKDLIQLAYLTGARISELTNLKRLDVCFNRKIATFRNTKNGEDRTIPLSDKVISILKAYPFGETFFKFHYDSFRFYFKQAKKKAGLNDFRFHDLRACFSTNALLSGMNVAEVSSITGHKDWGQLKRYTRIKAEDLIAKVNSIVKINTYT